ncbi:flavin reductase family protein [Streptomyces sp. TP-A0874]|uniref:flavin reductase family protein n=1 Tax=Streptomyces sp. TP-A0874 TaxID=549819 RepID=UPI00147A16BF|nr:flavin reductase family protein [Streptomyces sp. TP-A0874]
MTETQQDTVSIRGDAVGPVLRNAWSNFPTGVTIVTSHDPVSDKPKGITVNSFTSVSLDPPLVLVCVDNRSSSCESITRSGYFGVHFLMSQQWETALAFARPDAPKFESLSWSTSEDGVPILDDFVVAMECELADQYPGGDHTIMMGRVKAAHLREVNEGVLGFFHGRFVRLDHGTKLFPEVANLLALDTPRLDW